MSTVAIIGSNVGVLPLILCLRHYVDRVVVLGHDGDQLGALVADAFYRIDYRDVDTVVDALSSEKDLVGVVPGAHDLCYLAWANYMDLVHPSQINRQRHSERIHNKRLFRQTLQRVSPERCPRFIPLETALSGGELPFALGLYKPEHAGGGRGIRLIESRDDLLQYVAQDNLQAGIVEEYLVGTDHSVSLFLNRGEVKFFFVDREFCERGAFRICGSLTSRELHERLSEQEIPAGIAALAREFEIFDGFLHAQIRVSPSGEWHVIEFTLRLPGDCYPFVCELHAGVPYSLLYLQSFLEGVDWPQRSFLSGVLPSGKVVGRVCLQPGLTRLTPGLIPLMQVHSHRAEVPACYTIVFYVSGSDSIQPASESIVPWNSTNL